MNARDLIATGRHDEALALMGYAATLTPVEVEALRTSLQSRSLDGTDRLGVPFITWAAPGRVWCLHAYGRGMAESADPTLLCRALAIEREHPGWLNRVCDPTLDPSTPVFALTEHPAPPRTPPNIANISIDDLF